MTINALSVNVGIDVGKDHLDVHLFERNLGSTPFPRTVELSLSP
jgi:hypothetical protein